MQNATSRDGNSLLAIFDQHMTALRTSRRSQGFFGAVGKGLTLEALRRYGPAK